MDYLTKEQIFTAQDLPIEEVEVPEWGGKVRVRGLSAGERDAFEIANGTAQLKGENPSPRARLCALCALDAEGKLLFAPADVERLAAKSGAAVDRVFQAAHRLSGMRPEDVEKNSASGPGAASSSSSPGGSAAPSGS